MMKPVCISFEDQVPLRNHFKSLSRNHHLLTLTRQSIINYFKSAFEEVFIRYGWHKITLAISELLPTFKDPFHKLGWDLDTVQKTHFYEPTLVHCNLRWLLICRKYGFCPRKIYIEMLTPDQLSHQNICFVYTKKTRLVAGYFPHMWSSTLEFGQKHQNLV